MTHLVPFIAANLCGIASTTFAVLYTIGTPGSRPRWLSSVTGQNVMALAVCLVMLSAGVALWLAYPGHTVGPALTTTALFTVTAVMVWRTILMWKANHPQLTTHKD